MKLNGVMNEAKKGNLKKVLMATTAAALASGLGVGLMGLVALKKSIIPSQDESNDFDEEVEKEIEPEEVEE